MFPKLLLSKSFLAGLLGGILAGALSAVVVVTTGHWGSVVRTVTVQEKSIATPGGVSHAGGLTVRQVYERRASGVVFVNASNVSKTQSTAEYLKGENSAERGTATGSGFEIDRAGMVLTNWHVIQGASRVTVGLEHGKTVEASVVGKDPSHDIAVLRIQAGGLILHPLALGDSSGARVGDPVLAIGNPFGLARTLTTGVISALGREIEAPDGLTITNVLQTDAPINPGNSGGPLLNEAGQVVGINSQIETSGQNGGNVGIAFAIPIDTAKKELTLLEKGGTAAGA